jgi:GTPase SAR1 family protein
MTQTYYANANGVVLLFDITDKESFTNLPRWFEELNHYGPSLDRILVGNKSDLTDDRAVTTEEIEKWARISGKVK